MEEKFHVWFGNNLLPFCWKCEEKALELSLLGYAIFRPETDKNVMLSRYVK